MSASHKLFRSGFFVIALSALLNFSNVSTLTATARPLLSEKEKSEKEKEDEKERQAKEKLEKEKLKKEEQEKEQEKEKQEKEKSGSSSGESSNSHGANSGGTPGVFHLCWPFDVCPGIQSPTLGLIHSTSPNPVLGIIHDPQGAATIFENLVVTALVPSQTVNAAGLNFSANWGSTAYSAMLGSSSLFNSGNVLDFLGLNQAPGTPPGTFSSFQFASDAVNSGTSGYFVYVMNLGPAAFPASNTVSFNLGNFSAFKNGTVFWAFATNAAGSTAVESTPQSSAVIVDSPFSPSGPPPIAPQATPEPASLLLLGGGVLMLLAKGKRAARL